MVQDKLLMVQDKQPMDKDQPTTPVSVRISTRRPLCGTTGGNGGHLPCREIVTERKASELRSG